MPALQIVMGSTREGRQADVVTRWVETHAKQHQAFDTVELLDLREWPLPFFQETLETVGDFADPTFSDPLVKQWNTTLQRGDAYLFVLPEYNHSVPGVLKNAIDNVFVTFALRNKPAAAVAYSAGPVGGARAVEHLAAIAVEAEAAFIRNNTLVPFVDSAFGPDGSPTNRLTDVSLSITLDDLAWWTRALADARAAGELPPGAFRLYAASNGQG